MNLAHSVWDTPLRQTVIICLKIPRPVLPITRRTTLQTDGGKKEKEKKKEKNLPDFLLFFFFFYRLSSVAGWLGGWLAGWLSVRQRERARKRRQSETILPLCQIRSEHSCHFAPLILFERLRKGNLVLLQAPWGVKTLWCELSPNWLMTEFPHASACACYENICPLYLTRVGVFIIPF